MYQEIIYEQFPECNWTEFCSKAEDPIPVDAQKALEKEVDLDMFVGSYHAGDKHLQWSCFGFLLYLNTALMYGHQDRHKDPTTNILQLKYGGCSHRWWNSCM